MKYDAPTLSNLSDELKSLHTELSSHASDLAAAAGKLSDAWADNAGLDGFQQSYKSFTGEFGQEGDTSADTAIGKVNRLSQAVADALASAQAADHKVGHSF